MFPPVGEADERVETAVSLLTEFALAAVLSGADTEAILPIGVSCAEDGIGVFSCVIVLEFSGAGACLKCSGSRVCRPRRHSSSTVPKPCHTPHRRRTPKLQSRIFVSRRPSELQKILLTTGFRASRILPHRCNLPCSTSSRPRLIVYSDRRHLPCNSLQRSSMPDGCRPSRCMRSTGRLM